MVLLGSKTLLYFIKILLLMSSVESESECDEESDEKSEEDISGSFLIYGGSPALTSKNGEEGEFPFMAALGWRDENKTIQYQCGGMLINKNSVLTAAHCFYNRGKFNLPDVVFLGGQPLNELEQSEDLRFLVKCVTIYPEYDPSKRYHDIAILRFKDGTIEDLRFRPIALWKSRELETNETIAMGYGDTNFAGKRSQQLLKADLKVFPPENCESVYSGTKHYAAGIFTDKIICAGDDEGKKDTCSGDSGGPLIVEHYGAHYAVGITSEGQACSGDPPAIYTKISSYLEWIADVLKRSAGDYLCVSKETTKLYPVKNSHAIEYVD